MQGQYIITTYKAPHSLIRPVCNEHQRKFRQLDANTGRRAWHWKEPLHHDPAHPEEAKTANRIRGSAVTVRPFLLAHWPQNYPAPAATAQKSCHKHTDPRKQWTAKELQDLLKLISCRQKLGHASSARRQSIGYLILAPTGNRFKIKISWFERQFWISSSSFTFAQEILICLFHGHIQEIVCQ